MKIVVLQGQRQFKLSAEGASSNMAHLLQVATEQHYVPQDHAGARLVTPAALQVLTSSANVTSHVAYARRLALQQLGQGTFSFLKY